MIIPIRKPAPIVSTDTPGERVLILKRELDRVVDDINRQTAEIDRRIYDIEAGDVKVQQSADGTLTIG